MKSADFNRLMRARNACELLSQCQESRLLGLTDKKSSLEDITIEVGAKVDAAVQGNAVIA